MRESIARNVVMRGFALVVTCVLPSYAYSTMIDDFASLQRAEAYGPNGIAGSYADDSKVLGNERDLLVFTSQGSPYTSLDLLSGSGTSNSLLSHNEDADVLGASHVVWDGPDGDCLSIDFTGLNGTDLTESGLQTGFEIEVYADDLPAALILNVYSDAQNYSSFTLKLNGAIPPGSNKSYTLPFLGFSPSGGIGADFTNVGAIELRIETIYAGTDIQLDHIATTPEPGSILLLLGSALTLTTARRR